MSQYYIVYDNRNYLFDGINESPDDYEFTTEINLPSIYHKGCYLRNVTVPNDVKTTKEDLIVKAKTIIVGPELPLFNMDTLLTLKLSLDRLVDAAFKYGNSQFLEDLLVHPDLQHLRYSYDSIDYASSTGHINVLEWYIKACIPLIYSENAIHDTIRNGYYCVLKWWLTSGLTLKFNPITVMQLIAEGNRMDILKCWLEYGIPKMIDSKNDNTTYGKNLVYDPQHVMHYASYYGRIEMLDYAFPICGKRFWNDCIENLFSHGQIDVLKWWFQKCKNIKINFHHLYLASIGNQIEMLKWYSTNNYPRFFYKPSRKSNPKNTSLYVKTIAETILNAVVTGKVEILDWLYWSKFGISEYYMRTYSTRQGRHSRDSYYMDIASNYGQIEVLNWYKNHFRKLYYSHESLNFVAMKSDKLDVIRWWLDSGLEIKGYSADYLRNLVKEN
jgi:hypothetical protein